MATFGGSVGGGCSTSELDLWREKSNNRIVLKENSFFRVLIKLTSLFSGRIGRENILFCTRYEETSFTIIAFTSANSN